MKLELKGVLPSGNWLARTYTGKKGYWKRKPIMDTWGYLILEALEKAGEEYFGNTVRFKSRVVVNVKTIVKDKRKIQDEIDNIWFSIGKLIIDFLKKRRFFIDDTPRWVKRGKIEQKIGLPERVIVEIEEEEDEKTL